MRVDKHITSFWKLQERTRNYNVLDDPKNLSLSTFYIL